MIIPISFGYELGLWTIIGENDLYLSQPTLAWQADGVPYLSRLTACVARCSSQKNVETEHGEHVVGPIQCGHIAGIGEYGEYLCWVCQDMEEEED